MTSSNFSDYSEGKHNHIVSRQLPHLTEEIWQNISAYLSTKEWVKAAGTCKTSYTMSLKWVRLGYKTSPEGWDFVLQRCTKAVGMDIKMMGDTGAVIRARRLMDGIAKRANLVAQSRTSMAFASLKELRVSWQTPATGISDSQLASHMALASMAAAFHSLEVLVLSCERFTILPSFQTVKHLVVEQPDLQPVLDGLGGLPLLQTLSLVNSDESFNYCCDKIWDLILDQHKHLQHVHLQNLVPHTLACGGCRVHVSYAARSDVSEIDRMEDFVKWASSDLWVGVGAQLSSISVQDRNRSLEPSSTQETALKQMLSRDRVLDYVSLEYRRIGTSKQPLLVSPTSAMDLVRTRTLRMLCHLECHVRVERGAPLAWVNFSLVSHHLAGLDFDKGLDFVHGLQNFVISCRAFCGPACVELTQALALLGRRVHSNGGCHAWSLNSFEHGRVTKGFNQLMLCGCHACLSCLEADAKLSEGSILPDVYAKRKQALKMAS